VPRVLRRNSNHACELIRFSHRVATWNVNDTLPNEASKLSHSGTPSRDVIVRKRLHEPIPNRGVPRSEFDEMCYSITVVGNEPNLLLLAIPIFSFASKSSELEIGDCFELKVGVVEA
jgi:hypothetical protein